MARASNQFERLVTRSLQAKLVLSGDRVLFANEAAARLYGFEASADLVGRLFHGTLFPATLGRLHAPFEGEQTHFRRDGRSLRVDVKAVPLDWDGHAAVQVAVTDLDSLLARREAELGMAMQRADAGVAARNRFLAALGHEVRTPLNAIMGIAELLGSTALDDGQRALIRLGLESAEHLLGVVEDVMDFSALDSGGCLAEAAPFDPDAVVADLSAPIARRLGDRGVTFATEIDLRARAQYMGDQRAWRRVIGHLLGNAAKFTTDGSVTLRLLIGENGHGILVEVMDSGPGIAPERMATLFDGFEMPHAPETRSQGGLSLGLALSRRLARAMGGELSVMSVVGQGTTCRFYAPLERAALTEVLAPAAMAPGLTVLVVEDNPANQRIIAMLLERMGHICVVAPSGDACLSTFPTAHFDLVLMDLHMPGIDGFETTRRLRATPGWSQIAPVFALTADTRPEARKKAAEVGMNGFLGKPILVTQLAAVIAAAARMAPDRDEEPPAARA